MKELSYDQIVWIIENWFCILTDEGGMNLEIKPFILRPYQKRALREICENPDKNIIIEKTRQIGFTWLFAAYYDIKFIFGRNFQGLVIGKRRDFVDSAAIDTNKIMGKMKFILENIRNENLKKLLSSKIKKNGEMISFMESSFLRMKNNLFDNIISGESSSESSGRGGSWSLVLWDETAFTGNSHQLFASVKPNSKRLFMLSTLNPWKPNNIFNDIRKNIETDIEVKKQWHKIRVHWSEFFNEIWYKKQCADLNNDPVLIAAELDIDDRGAAFVVIFSTFGKSNYTEKAIFNPDLMNTSVLSFDFGLADYMSCTAGQYDPSKDETRIIDGFDLDNVPFNKVIAAIFAPSLLLLKEIQSKTSQKFGKLFERFYINSIHNGYKRFIITGDPSAGARSIRDGYSIHDEILKYTSKVVFYREDVEAMLSFIRGNSERIFIDKRLDDVREVIENYQYALNRDGKPVAPLHDRFSHRADTIRYLMLLIRMLFQGGQKFETAQQKRFDPNNRKVFLIG